MARCRTCRAEIVWLPTKQGNKMPVDRETWSPGETVFEVPKHTSHFATCPQADQHRRRDRGPQENSD